jgi:hypothetical protein
MYKSFIVSIQALNSLMPPLMGGAGTNAKDVLATSMQGGIPPSRFLVFGHELSDTWVVSGFMDSYFFHFER